MAERHVARLWKPPGLLLPAPGLRTSAFSSSLLGLALWGYVPWLPVPDPQHPRPGPAPPSLTTRLQLPRCCLSSSLDCDPGEGRGAQLGSPRNRRTAGLSAPGCRACNARAQQGCLEEPLLPTPAVTGQGCGVTVPSSLGCPGAPQWMRRPRVCSVEVTHGIDPRWQ